MFVIKVEGRTSLCTGLQDDGKVEWLICGICAGILLHVLEAVTGAGAAASASDAAGGVHAEVRWCCAGSQGVEKPRIQLVLRWNYTNGDLAASTSYCGSNQ